MKPKTLRKMALLCSVAVLGISVLAATAAAQKSKSADAVSLRSWKLAFVRDGNIWVANGDGSNQKLIIKDGDYPAWSPDKKQIAFVREGNIWISDADGRGQRQMTSLWKQPPTQEEREEGTEAVWAEAVAWDRVRNRLTFSFREQTKITTPQNGQISTLTAEAIADIPVESGARPGMQVLWDITNTNAECAFSLTGHPAWSRDGERLAFVRNGDIWIGLRSKEEEAVPEWTRRWDWDITRLAAVARYDAPTGRASNATAFADRLSWSPSGNAIAYSISRASGSGIAEVHLLRFTLDRYLNVSQVRDQKLADDALYPSFSPDGKLIAYFKYGESGPGDIWVMRSDGSGKRLLIRNADDVAW